ncbi:M16 family metallopeptidase [Marinigracilibium pacificum]|uniref:Insulinase family protein n=1 Tax=Marinigracilibium pacificum TaxID=2729599 RepID=A0A848IUC0_9BACT|nr:pitrilysin family protein [Marinigracilibium pacificum]NMM46895.1 insulinase family protein [Marinigracilibium pacificum]
MVNFSSFTLDNGLKVFVHEDHTTPLAAFNLLYNVGSRDEDENKTGFAHLFEHLMFGGSKNIPSFDEPLQKVGGENNAFTSPDITNYYITLPAINLETAFWLESDRMLALSFDQQVLDVQKKVVIEEFKQRYLNQPYGEAWLKLRPLAYKSHPYRWATIGKDISHIEDATMDDVKSFFYKFYRPNNAVLVVAGPVKTETVKQLAEKWFGPIPAGDQYERNLPVEDKQKERRIDIIESDVPSDAIYKVYHIPGRLDKRYHDADLISDVLGRGKSSRLYESLVKEKKFFFDLNAYVTGSIDPGLLVVAGKTSEGVSLDEAEKAIDEVVSDLAENGVGESELEKVKNKAEASLVFGEVELLNRAMSIAMGANLGNPNLINEESEMIQKVTTDSFNEMSRAVLKDSNSSTLLYKKKDK